VTTLIERFGVLGVFLLMVPESACVPVPSEVTLLFSGFAVGMIYLSHPGKAACYNPPCGIRKGFAMRRL
jgi:membrane protein DedA with SNARE-associated domain